MLREDLNSPAGCQFPIADQTGNRNQVSDNQLAIGDRKLEMI
jgi:hypothetical protein